MTTPHEHCLKEGQLSALETTTYHINEQLKEANDTMKQLVSVLQLVAAQGQQIISLQASVKRLDDSESDHGRRIGQLEVKQEGSSVRVGFLMGGAGAISSLGTAAVMKLLKLG